MSIKILDTSIWMVKCTTYRELLCFYLNRGKWLDINYSSKDTHVYKRVNHRIKVMHFRQNGRSDRRRGCAAAKSLFPVTNALLYWLVKKCQIGSMLKLLQNILHIQIFSKLSFRENVRTKTWSSCSFSVYDPIWKFDPIFKTSHPRD